MEQESGIGGEMVRTKAKQATNRVNRRAAIEPGLGCTTRVYRTGCRSIGFESDMLTARAALKALAGDGKKLGEFQQPANAEAQEKEREGKQGEFSQAALWGAEPEWQGELSEEMAETGAGSREPES